MTKYREILRLAGLGFSNRNIALSVPCSRNTVSKVLKRAQELNLCSPLQDNQTDEVLEKLFYPQLNNRPQKRMPDYDLQKGKTFSASTASVSLSSSGQEISNSLARFKTRLTVFLETLQLSAMFCWLSPRPLSQRISRYLVIVMTSFECIYTFWCMITF